MADMKNDNVPISKELKENLSKVNCDFSEEELHEIFSDQQKSAAFFTLVLFCLASGKNFDELPEAFWKE